MATVKEIYVEAKKSKNFQTYTCGALVQLTEDEAKDPAQIDTITRYNQTMCRAKCNEQIALDK